LRQSALTLEQRADPVDWHSMTGWKRLALMGLMVCLPIPMLAASGLAVPLPSVVYRVAVGVAERTQAVAVHVPGFEAVVAETKQVARHGKIRFSAEELAVAGSPTRAATPAGEDRPQRPLRARHSTRRVAHRAKGTKEPAARATRLKSVAPTRAELDHATRAVAAPGTQVPPRASDSPGRDERVQDKKDPVPAENPSGGSTAGPSNPPESRTSAPKVEHKTSSPRDEPTTSPPREEPRNVPGTDPILTTPPRLTPPPPVPPLPVSPPIDPLPDPVPLKPKAQLEEIAAELRKIVAARNADRVGQAVEKIESAVARLEKTPPDSQGAVGDIKNAVQKLDAALTEHEINIAERTLFVTRLNAVSEQLKAAP
jgi:hypothetical protein